MLLFYWLMGNQWELRKFCHKKIISEHITMADGHILMTNGMSVLEFHYYHCHKFVERVCPEFWGPPQPIPLIAGCWPSVIPAIWLCICGKIPTKSLIVQSYNNKILRRLDQSSGIKSYHWYICILNRTIKSIYLIYTFVAYFYRLWHFFQLWIR